MILYYLFPYLLGGGLILAGAVFLLAWFVMHDWTVFFDGASSVGARIFVLWWIGVFGG